MVADDARERRRVVLVGAGRVAEVAHLPALRALSERVDLVSVVDVDADRAAGVAADWGVPGWGVDLSAELERHRPELVVVATPPAGHVDPVRAALAAGAWAWCEKPAALSLAEFDAMVADEVDGGPHVGFVLQHRSGTAARALAEQIRAGALGRPLVGVCHTLWYRPQDYYDKPWRGSWATEGGGTTISHGVHQMDLMAWLLGDWVEVRAMTGTLQREIEVEDVSMAAVSFANGAMVSMVSSVLSPREESYLRFDFSDATVELSHVYGYDDDCWTWTPRPGVDPARVAGWRPPPGVGGSHAVALGQFLDAMDAGVRPPASGADARRALELVTALYESARTGVPVRREELVPTRPCYHDTAGRHAPGGGDAG